MVRIDNHPWMGMVTILKPSLEMVMTGGWFMALFYPHQSKRGVLGGFCHGGASKDVYIYIYIYICEYTWWFIPLSKWVISLVISGRLAPTYPIYNQGWTNPPKRFVGSSPASIYIYIYISRYKRRSNLGPLGFQWFSVFWPGMAVGNEALFVG